VKKDCLAPDEIDRIHLQLSVMARPFMRWGHLSHQIPYYMGIFSPELGTYLIAFSLVFRIVSLVGVGLIFIFGINMFILE
jgi:hypothetical protein